MKRIVPFFVLIAALTTPFAQATEKPLILSTIKPVHMLVSSIAGDTAESQQIVPDYASPHHYSLKPSDIRRLNRADLVFRIDPMLESQLNKSLSNIDAGKLVVLSKTKGMQLLDADHAHNNHRHNDNDHHDAHDKVDAQATDHETEPKDYHLWLDPDNAIVMAEHIRDALTKALPERKSQLSANAQALIGAIKQADHDIAESLKGVTKQPFLVMHNAWQYFTHHYQLNQLGSITQQEGLSASGKSLSKARQQIRDSGVRCIVSEVGVKTRTLAVLTEDLEVNTTEIDPLGRMIPVSDQAYPEFLRYTAEQLSGCLNVN